MIRTIVISLATATAMAVVPVAWAQRAKCGGVTMDQTVTADELVRRDAAAMME